MSSETANIAKSKILQIPIDQLGKNFIEDMFASYHDKETNTYKEANFDPTDEITLTNKEYKWVDGTAKTTLGILVFNRYCLEATGIIEHLHYWNRTIDKSCMGDLDNEINNLVIIDQISTKTLGEFVDRRDALGFWCSAFLSVSISPGLVRPMDNVNKRKRELFKQYDKELHSDNSVEQIMTTNKIEKELMGMVRENLKDDPGYDMYASGDGNLDNNYKTINVMRGAVMNKVTNKYDVVESSLMEGVKKKDIPAFANSVVAGAYPSAIGTAEAGAMAKEILAVLQSEHLNPNPNSDCGTKSTIPFTITKKNKKYVIFRYIDDGGNKVFMDLHSVNNYVGKTVNLYSPQGCLDKAICGKCAGRVFHNLEVTQIGLLATAITQKLLNLKLKSKHDLSQSAAIIPENYVTLDKSPYVTIDNGILKNKVTMKMFIPRLFEELSGFVLETSSVICMGIFPIKFYDKNGSEVGHTLLTIPAVKEFKLYDDLGEDPNYYIATYEPDSQICDLGMSQNVINVQFFLEQIFLNSKSPQLPYHLMVDMMFRCMELNKIDLDGPTITYELLARRLCRHGTQSFASVYGKNPNVDPMSYEKLPYRKAVHEAGPLQAILFQDVGLGVNRGLAMTLNGVEPEETPLEKVVKA